MSRPSQSTDAEGTASRSSISVVKAIRDQAGEGTQAIDEAAMDRRVNRKMDIALLPLLSLLYLFNGLDRGNVGNAQTQGFTNDIGAVPDDLNLAVSLFFVTFVLLQPPSAAIGRWLGAKHWIPIMMVGWGLVTLCQAFIKGRGSLIITRLLIGAFEAGFYPTAVAYLSFFYCRYDLAVRVGLFYGQYAVAGAFSGAISYGVFHLNNGRLKNWQYLFIIEGALTVFFGLLAWILLPASPGSAWFLTAQERRFAADRMKAENALFVEHTYDSDGVEQDRLTKRDFVETAKDWKFWYVLAFNICASVPGQAFSVFLPLVVQGLGYSSIEANLMSVPPYVCGAVGLYCFTLSSDYHKERGYHILVGILVALIGLIATVTVESSGGKYAALCVLLLGSYVAAPLTVAWLSGNTPEPGKRSLVLGLNGFGNIAGVIGAQLYRAKYKPDYKVPFYITLGFVAVALMGYLSYRLTLAAVNQRKLEIMRHKSQEEIEKERTDGTRYADKKWTFIYGL
ncbi:major facilitator superfamily transporter [Colletotrichum navitas]|uniref:Major facilitator superfamily transporter n=1 Tax=Colletotrichum navitas TaxID=681940 RepID=A0AAD8PS76_9PEZI|nr:major facilitator superfamily transporter [Colletotrichum navitas]KAK1574748.1 major facilitator superfamily transporter [Colletotrichum navitas]